MKTRAEIRTLARLAATPEALSDALDSAVYALGPDACAFLLAAHEFTLEVCKDPTKWSADFPEEWKWLLEERDAEDELLLIATFCPFCGVQRRSAEG